MVMVALLANAGTAVAQEPIKVEKKFYNQTLGIVGLTAILMGES